MLFKDGWTVTSTRWDKIIYYTIHKLMWLFVLEELNEDCLPRLTRSLITIDIPIKNQIFKLCDELFEKKTDETMEKFPKQVIYELGNYCDQLKDILYIFRSLRFQTRILFHQTLGISILSIFNQKKINLLLLYHQN